MSAERCLPITFMDRLVPRILDRSKTVTRRLFTEQPPAWVTSFGYSAFTPEGHISGRGILPEEGPAEKFYRLPYRVGELRWVRESSRFLASNSRGDVLIYYPADGAQRWVTLTEAEMDKLRARKRAFTAATPGRFLYRSCARIFLRVTSLRAERLQNITEEDARAEGLVFIPFEHPHPETGLKGWWCGGPHPVKGTAKVFPAARAAFLDLWDWVHRNREDAQVKANPWLWVPGFQLEQVLVRGEGRAA